MTTTHLARPTITTLAFRANAQAIVGHVITGETERARHLLTAMPGHQLAALARVAGTVADLAGTAQGEGGACN